MKPPNTKTVLEVAAMLATSERVVLGMIAEGKLQAINTSNGKKRPRWAIPNESIDSLGKTKRPQQLNIPKHV